MKYIKLFEELSIPYEEFEEFLRNGYELSPRESQILLDLVGENFLKSFKIMKEDNYYYINYYDGNSYSNKLDGFKELKDYLSFRYYLPRQTDILYGGGGELNPNKLLELVKSTTLDLSFDLNYLAGISSSHDSCLEVMKILLKDPKIVPNLANACVNGSTEMVKLLLKDPRVDPSAKDNLAIRWASEFGHTEIVKLLLKDPRVDPTGGGFVGTEHLKNNQSLVLASRNGHVEVVKSLVEDPRVDPSKPNNYAIRWANQNKHKEVMKLLVKDPRVRAKLTKSQIKQCESL